MSDRKVRRWRAAGLLALVTANIVCPLPLWGQAQGGEINRKVKSRVQPVYPELARHMNIGGVVKVQVVVAPNGNVKTTKLVGGHPLLANAAMDAIRKWRFEPAQDETTGVIEIRFDTPSQQQ